MDSSLHALKKQVEDISYNEDVFHTPFGEDKYIFGYISPENETELDIFAIKTIYDSIIDLDNKIKFSFNHIVDYILQKILVIITLLVNLMKVNMKQSTM